MESLIRSGIEDINKTLVLTTRLSSHGHGSISLAMEMEHLVG